MAKVEIVGITPEGALYVARNMRAKDRQEVYALMFDAASDEDVARAACQTPDTAWEFRVDGRPVSVMGVTPLWPGVWSAWMLATDEYLKVILAMTKLCRRVIMPMLWNAGAHRLEAKSVSHHHVAHGWLEHMGATLENVLENYGKNGEDFYVFAWLRKNFDNLQSVWGG